MLKTLDENGRRAWLEDNRGRLLDRALDALASGDLPVTNNEPRPFSTPMSLNVSPRTSSVDVRRPKSKLGSVVRSLRRFSVLSDDHRRYLGLAPWDGVAPVGESRQMRRALGKRKMMRRVL